MRTLLTQPGSSLTRPPNTVVARRTSLLPSRDALRALEADRGRDHAVGADPPLAADAADVRLAVGVPVADGRVGARRLARAGRSAPSPDRRVGHRVRSRWRSTTTDSMTTSSTGRSMRAGRGGGDRVDDLAAGAVGDLAEDRVLAVEVRRRADGDEELRAVGAGAGVGHRQQVRLVELQLGVELVGELVARAAGAGAQRVAALDHEAADDPVEDRAVVELVGGLLAGAPGRSTHACPRRARRSCSTVLGAWFGKSCTTMSPWLVFRVA